MTDIATEGSKRPDPISLRIRADSDIEQRLRATATEQRRAVNWVINEILDQHLPPLPDGAS